MKIKWMGMAMLFLFAAVPARAVDWGSALDKLGVNKTTSIGSTRVGEGLKEALRVGIDKAVAITSKEDGFLKNPAISIPVPERLRPIEAVMRKAGLGAKVDEFVLSMNRSAEAAAPQAKEIFIQAVADMSIEDAEGLLKGGDTAATEYFRKKTSARLVQAFKPVVAQKISQYGVPARYQALTAKYQAMPLASKFPAPSIEDYTVQKSVDGLFYTLGEQEKAIRRDPMARVTPLLKEVFKG